MSCLRLCEARNLSRKSFHHRPSSHALAEAEQQDSGDIQPTLRVQAIMLFLTAPPSPPTPLPSHVFQNLPVGRTDVYVRITKQTSEDFSSQVSTISVGNTATPQFNEKLTLSGFFGESILVEVMNKLRFGHDKTICHTLVELTPAIFKAGRKGTLHAWYGLEMNNSGSVNAGEISLSFSFDEKKPPSNKPPIKFAKPWFLQAGGLYVGLKDTWTWTKEYERTSSIASKIDGLIEKLAKEKGGMEKAEVDEWVCEKLASFDSGVDNVVPKVAEKMPFVDIKIEMLPTTLPQQGFLKLGAPAETESSPEDDKPEECKSPLSRTKSLSSRITGYPSLLGASARRTPLKFVERG